MRVRERWKVAGWAVCCVSSGCPCGWTSSGSAQPAAAAAAGSAPVGSGSAEHPPVRGQENSKSGSRSSVEDSAPSSGAKTELNTPPNLLWLAGREQKVTWPSPTVPAWIKNHVNIYINTLLLS